MASRGIRKISLTPKLMDEMRDYAWDNRTSVSQVVRDIIGKASDNPTFFNEWPDDDRGNTKVVTVYVPDDIWLPAKRRAAIEGIAMSSIIRRGFLATLEEGSEVGAA